jgi:hypothetical protein
MRLSPLAGKKNARILAIRSNENVDIVSEKRIDKAGVRSDYTQRSSENLLARMRIRFRNGTMWHLKTTAIHLEQGKDIILEDLVFSLIDWQVNGMYHSITFEHSNNGPHPIGLGLVGQGGRAASSIDEFDVLME